MRTIFINPISGILFIFTIFAWCGAEDNDGDGYAVVDGDCNDSDYEVFPGAQEGCGDEVDQDCSGDPDDGSTDSDGDGYVWDACTRGEDCDDSDATIYPNADDLPYDEIDQDCDGSDLTDVDGDGYDSTNISGGEDCNDSDGTIYPGADEVCEDGIDQDCDGNDFICGSIDLAFADASFVGENYHDLAGYSVSTAGDVNGDGYDDIIIGAMYNDDGGDDAGKAYLLYGPLYGEIDLSSADVSFIGEKAGDLAGYPVSTAGDVDGDGYDDIIIGAMYNDQGGSKSGKAYLLYGPLYGTIELSSADATFVGEDSDNWAGCSLSTAGDVNGDGYSDIIIGAPGKYCYPVQCSYEGKAYLLYGPLYGTIELSSADATFPGEESYDRAGRSVSIAGDVNGDGYSDIIIGAPKNDDACYDCGKTYLFYGPIDGTIELSSSDASFLGEGYDPLTGWSVSTAGDVNRDGYDDIIIGGYWVDKVYLLYGPLNGTIELSSSDASFIMEEEQDLPCSFGWSVSTGGDVNGDGYSDIIIGLPEKSIEGNDYRGKAYLLYGPLYGEIDLSSADISYIGEHRYDRAGVSVSTAGDVNGDGYSDIIIGAVYAGSGKGKAYLFYGN